MTERTSWPRVWVLLIAGVAIAFQVGKAPAALPALIDDLGIDLVTAGWIVSIFSMIAAGSGVVFGIAADRIGHLRGAVAGLLLSAAANIAGGFATSAEAVLVGRAAEGFGFILTVVSLPPLIARECATQADRNTALGLWGAFLPAGMGTMLLLAPPILHAAGWPGLWIANGVLIAVWAIILWLTLARAPASDAGTTKPVGPKDLGRIFASLPALLLAGIFLCYSAQFIAVTAFLPTMLVEQQGLALPLAAALGAGVVLANIIGNVAAGFALTRGFGRAGLLLFACLAMAICSAAVFASGLPLEIRFAGAVAFSAFGGLIPGVLMASAPLVAPSPALVGSVIGLFLQGAGIGQVAGAPLLAATVTAFGAWDHAALFTVACALAGGTLSLSLRGRLEPTRRDER